MRWKPVANAFCPTGEGGGQDNSCGSKGALGKSVLIEEQTTTASVLHPDNPTYRGIEIKARDRTGKLVGTAGFRVLDDGKTLRPVGVEVGREFRRQGIAQRMYQHLLDQGYVILQQKAQTKEGKKFREGLSRKGIT